MLTKSIRAPGVVSRIFGPISTPQQHAPYVPPPPRTMEHWPKARYDIWHSYLESHFKLGELLTFLYVNPKEDATEPPIHYSLRGIENFWYKATMDFQLQQPKAFFMENLTFKTGSTFWVAPDRMRRLTAKELELVNLQNSPPLSAP